MPSIPDLPESPVTGNNCVRIVDTFAVADIVRLYRQQENTDVSDYLRHGDEVYLMECGDTGYRFYYPYEIAGDEAFYQKLGSERKEKGLDYDRDWSPDHQFAFEAIGPDETVLEIGCNTGKFLERVLEKTKNVSGLEFNPLAVEAAQKKGLDVKNLDIAALAENKPESYDVVCAFQVLEHISNVGPFINACLRVLKPGGKLIFSVPNNEPYFQRFSKYEVLNLPPHHMGLWNLAAFEKLCGFFEMRLAGFEHTGKSSFLADTYLRAKLMSGIESLPGNLALMEKAKILAFSPMAGLKNSFDYLKGKRNNAHLSIAFSRR